MHGKHIAYTFVSVFAIALLITMSFGIVVLNDMVTELKKSNERPVETDWTTWPGWPEWPEWPSEYPIKYTIEWPDDQSVSITHYKPIWADAVAEKLTTQGGKFFLGGTEYVVDLSANPVVTAEEYMFKVVQYTDSHVMETMYIPYEQIVRIKFVESV